MRRLFTAVPRVRSLVPSRFLSIHESDSKVFMQKYNIDVQRGFIVTDAAAVPDTCARLVKEFKTQNFIVKSQILAGGRGKGTFANGFKGGVKFSTDAAKAQENTKAMLGNRLTTAQTPPGGIEVKKVFIAECLNFKRELYVAFLLDRASRGPVLVASTEGGVDIEEVAHKNPSAILKLPLTTVADKSKKCGFRVEPKQANAFQDLATKLGFKDKAAGAAVSLFKNLCQMSAECDITQLEVNPLVETDDGRVTAVDAKLNFDDSAEFRQAEAFDKRDYGEEDPREVEASKWELNYVGLDGEIGCLVNGAGLAMATMDIIKLKKMNPANFLDVGGTANAERVAAAFNIITSDPKVKGILVNIFGGIVNCDMIAKGIITAAKTTKLKVPVVVRLSGTDSESGIKRIEECGLGLYPAHDMDSAASRIVELVQSAK